MKINSTLAFYSFSNNCLKTVFSTMILVLACSPTISQVNVLMNHNDLKRTGWNRNESVLTTANVSGGNFGKIFSRTVDDQIYAQPLVVTNVRISGIVRNIVLVATVNNSLYAFDADDPNASAPYWQANLTFEPDNYRAVKALDMTYACGYLNYKDFSGNMGIVGTPAIDTITHTLYVVSRSVTKTAPAKFVQYLHAIDIRTGVEKPGSPVYITASVPGKGNGNVNGVITFDQQKQNQRPGLLLYNGIVYIAWASHCDWTPYQGWIIGYDATNLQQKYVYNSAPNGGLAGIWMSGQPPSVDDDGNLYVSTGNGTTGQNGNPNDPVNRGSSLLKLSSTLTLKDFFTPANHQYLNDLDLDFGVNGVLLLPDTRLSLTGSKEGHLFLIDNNNMGHTTDDNSNVLQTINVGPPGSRHRHLHGSPVYFRDADNNEYIYTWAEESLLTQFPFDRSKMLFDTINARNGYTALPMGMPGAMLSVSSNGSQTGTGILWASHPIHGDANMASVPGVLQAFDAADVTKELWNSNWNSKRDSIGIFAKFVPPTVANGKVYMATFSNSLNVYGLNPPPASECTSTLPPVWQSADIGYVSYPGDVCVNNGVYTITASGQDIWNTADGFHYVFQPVISNKTELTARIVSIDNTDASARCGIMFRQNLDAGSPYVFLNLIPGNRIYLQERFTQNAYATRSGTSIVEVAPYWLKIYNDGNKYVSYASADGTDWKAIDSVTLALGPHSYVGIAYTTRNNSVLGTAVVDNVNLTVGDLLQPDVLSFTGKNVNDQQALLSWTTSLESQSDHFEIERSTKNTDFKSIGTVPGAGATNKTHDYFYTDNLPVNGVNYYRLKQVDINGKSTYSSIITVNFNFRKIKIFPNPAGAKIYIQNNDSFSLGNDLRIQLMDFSGKVVFKGIFKTKGVNIITLNVPPRLANGMYILRIINSKEEKQGDKIFINR